VPDSSQYTTGTIGVTPDDVTLTLAGTQLLVAESWDVHESVLEQPSTWSLRCGWGGTAKQFLTQYPCGTKFTLTVGGALQATGGLDGRRATGGTGATTIVLKGRDALAKVYDTYVDAQQTFTDTTYTGLVWRVLLYLGLVTGSAPDPTQLASTNDANRQIKAGKPVVVLQPPRSVDQIIEDADGNPTTANQALQITAKPGERWMAFLRRYLDPAGLVLWAAANGTYVLSVPNTQQAPLYYITRRAVDSNAVGNASWYEFIDDCTHRHTSAMAYGRGGGRKTGVSKVKGTTLDLEMIDLGYQGQPIAFHNVNVQSVAQAQNYAERKLAEERREGYQLWYEIPGHTLPCVGPQGGVAVVSVDTVVQVDDEELGISGPFYIESLVRQRTPQTSTRVRLVRPQDIVLTPGTSAT
jgi:prophage tail gpP-like protein